MPHDLRPLYSSDQAPFSRSCFQGEGTRPAGISTERALNLQPTHIAPIPWKESVATSTGHQRAVRPRFDLLAEEV